MSIEDLVSDWASFEEFISSLCQTKEVQVEHNVSLTGKSGVRRQIDVVMRATQGFTSHLVLVECKYWKRAVTRQHVDSFVTAIQDLNASRGIIFSMRGFQEGAIALAKHNGIELFKLRELKVEERFGPATPIGLYRNYLWKSIRNVAFPEIHSWQRDISHLNFSLILGGDNQSRTPVLNSDDWSARTLEEVIDWWSNHAATDLALKAKAVLFDGAGGVRRQWRHIRHTPHEDSKIRIILEGTEVIIPRITYDLGITIWQEHEETDIQFYRFVVAVEDCIQGVVHKAVRKKDDLVTQIRPTADRYTGQEDEPMRDTQRVLLMEGLVPFDFDRMEKGKYYDQPGYPEFLPAEMVAEWQAK